MSLFRYDSKFNMILSRVFDIMLLNILWLICSIPIITIGTSTTALYYSIFKIKSGEDYGIIKMFFHSFFQNIRQSCGLTLLFLMTGILLYIDINVYITTSGALWNVFKIISVIALIIWGILVSYSFPLLARFENSNKAILKNAFFMSISNIGKTSIVAVSNTLPVVIILGLPSVFALCLPIWCLFGISGIAYINSNYFLKIFEKHMTVE